MKILLLLALLMSGFAHAASPEQDYLAARDGYIKRFNAKRWTGEELKRITAQELAALRDPERAFHEPPHAAIAQSPIRERAKDHAEIGQ